MENLYSKDFQLLQLREHFSGSFVLHTWSLHRLHSLWMLMQPLSIFSDVIKQHCLKRENTANESIRAPHSRAFYVASVFRSFARHKELAGCRGSDASVSQPGLRYAICIGFHLIQLITVWLNMPFLSPGVWMYIFQSGCKTKRKSSCSTGELRHFTVD